LNASYRQDLPNVLNGINCTILLGEKSYGTSLGLTVTLAGGFPLGVQPIRSYQREGIIEVMVSNLMLSAELHTDFQL
jgi:hypothetical protein